VHHGFFVCVKNFVLKLMPIKCRPVNDLKNKSCIYFITSINPSKEFILYLHILWYNI